MAVAVGLLASGLLTTMGGAVRWAGCLTPSTAATCASMYGDAATLASEQAAPLLAAGWFVLAATFLGLVVTPGVPRAASALLVASGIAAATLAINSVPVQGSSLGGERIGWLLMPGVPAVAGAIVMAEEGCAWERTWWLGLALVAVGVGHSVLGVSLPFLWSDSADDPVGLFLVAGVLTVTAGAVVLWGAARSR